MKGLKRLEYRGYDSAGIAFDGDENVVIQGENLTETRWNTFCVTKILGNFTLPFAAVFFEQDHATERKSQCSRRYGLL